VDYTSLSLTSLLFFALSALSIFFVLRTPLVTFFLDAPDRRKMHQLQIPRIGGFAILISYAVSLLILYFFSPDLFQKVLLNDTGSAIAYAALLVFIVGFFDDTTFVNVTVPVKFAMQFGVAIGVVYIFDISFQEVFVFDYSINLGQFGKVATVFWIVGVTNALNIVDGIDGLAGSVTITSLLIAAAVVFISGNTDILFVVLPLIAVILGFLVFNYPPAKLFAGDTGSLFFGSLVAILSVKVASLGSRGVDSLAAFYIAAFPVIEVWVSMVRRYSYARRDNQRFKDAIRKVVSPDNLHMHHRLIFKGYSHEQALHFLIFFAVSISSVAIILVLTDNLILKSASVLYSMLFLIMVLKRLDYGKRNYHNNQNGEAVRRVIAITGDSDYFEHSLRHFTRNRYWIARFERVSDIMGRRVDAFVVYNETVDRIHVDIQRAMDIRSINDRPIFFITDADKNSIPELTNKQVYFIKKPVDMPYLVHDIEKIVSNGGSNRFSEINGTLTVEASHAE